LSSRQRGEASSPRPQPGQLGEFEIVYVENTNNHRNYRVNFGKVSEALGFDCQYTLDYGIAEIKRALQCGLITEYRNPK
jgi:hypothetical protein